MTTTQAARRLEAMMMRNRTGPQARVWCVKAGIWMPAGWYTCGFWQGGVVPVYFRHVNHVERAAGQPAREASDGGHR